MNRLLIITSILLATTNLGAFAGRTAGPVRHDDTVLARSIDRYQEEFEGGEQALVAAKADGDIDLVVYDLAGNVVAADRDDDGTPVVSWVPSKTAVYIIKVLNNEYHDLDYTIGVR